MTLVLSHSIALLILNFVLYGEKNKVEAKKQEVVPVPGWFNNVEGFVMPNAKESTDPSYIERHVEFDDTFNSMKKIKRKRKKMAAKKLKEDRKKSSDRKKRKKHRLGGNRLKFIKSDINDNEVKDSKFSGSQEKHAQRKPVDIIVHIKMEE